MPFLDEKLETLNPAALRIVQREKLRTMLDAILPDNAFYHRKLGRVDTDAAANDWTTLPFTTRAEIQADQAAHPPFGSNLSFPIADYVRFH